MPTTASRYVTTAAWAGAITVLVNVIGFGHRLTVTVPYQVLPNSPPPEALWVAVIGVLIGTSISLLAFTPSHPWARVTGALTAALLWTAGVEVTLQRAGVIALDFERLWPFNSLTDPSLLGPTSTGPIAGVVLLMLALALTLTLADRGRTTVAVIGLLLALSATTNFLSMLYPEPLIPNPGWRTVPHAIGAGILATGVGLMALAGPDAWPVRRMTGNSVRGMLMRWFMPFTIVMVVVTDIATMRVFSNFSPAIGSLLNTATTLGLGILIIYYLSGIIGGRLDLAEQETVRLNRLYVVVSEANAMLTRVRDPQALFDEACRITIQSGGFDTAWVGVVEPETLRVRPTAAFGRSTEWLPSVLVSAADTPEGRGPTGTAIRENRPDVCRDVGTDPRMAVWRDDAITSGLRSMVAFPLSTHGQVTHALTIYSAEPDWFNAEQVALLSGLAENISYALSVLATEQLQAEAEARLVDSEAQFRALIESSSDLVTIVDVTGTIRYQSPSALSLLGHSPDERVGGNMRDLVHPEDLPEVDRLARRTLEQAEPGGTVVCRLRHKNGSWRVVETEVWNMLAVPGVNGIVIHARDVTARETLEAQLRQAQKMEAVGQLAGGIAHDFNNILSVIMANAGLLGTTAASDAAREELRDLQSAAERGKAMVRQIMGISRIETLAVKPTDLGALIERTAGVLRRILPANIQIRPVVTPGLPAALVDAGSIEQILLNLATNARDAMPGGGELRLVVSRASAADLDQSAGREIGEHLTVAAEDTGTGMDEATLKRVFDPFFTTKAAGAGTGLGLAMVRGLMTLHGGSIGVTSAPGKGTSIRLTFPASLKPPGRASGPMERVAAPQHGTETILVVDDEEMLRRAAKRILESNGYKVLVAEDGLAALQTLRQGKVDLVFTDMMMPQLGGGQLYHRATKEFGAVKFLVASGYTQSEAPGIEPLPPEVPFVMKPWTMEELLEAVREALDLRPE